MRAGRAVTPSVVADAWKIHNSLRKFAAHFSIRTPFAARVLDTYGHRFSQNLADQYRAGAFLPDLAAEQEISQKLLVKLIEATGTKVSKGRRRPLYDEKAVRALYLETGSVRRIQVHFGMSWATANKILHELGLK